MRAFLYRITLVSVYAFACTVSGWSQGNISPNYPSCGFDEITHQHCLEDPQLMQETKHFLQHIVPVMAASGKNAVEPLMTISVVVHVIHSGEPIGQGSNISNQQVIDQIAILSRDYQGLNHEFYETPVKWADRAGIPNIQFLLATVDPNGNPTNGITRHNIPVTGTSWTNNNINSEIKPATNWDPHRYMNIYVVAIPGTTAAGGVVGYSNYPTPSLIGADRDGPVIDYRWFGGPGHPTSGWRPITHETGHYLGLPHTFNGFSCTSDDGISDTPNADDATNNYNNNLDCSNSYPVGPISCTEEHLYVNYMDYVTENCYTSFTQGQVNVMREVLSGTSGIYGSRAALLTNAPSQTVIPVHDAGIVRLVSPEPNNCTNDVLVPTVTLRNFGTALLTQTNISYQVNNGPLNSFVWQGNLQAGGLANVTLPAFTPPDGQYSIKFFTQNPNGQPDQRTNNDALETALFTYFAFDPPMLELAEGTSTLPTLLGTYQFNFGNDDFKWQISPEASAYGYGLGAFLFDNRAGNATNNPSDTYDLLITRHFDFSEVNDAALYFDVSYATYNALHVDTLYVLVATGCSQNFNLFVYKKWGENLATAPPTQSPFIPMPAQWRTEGVDLSYFDGQSDVTIGFLNVSNWGNRLYLDNIRVGVDCGSLAAEWEITPNGCDNPPGTCSGEATVNVPISNGDVFYEWEGYPITYNQPSVSGLCAGEVQVTITDEFGCEIVASNDIPQQQTPSITVASQGETAYQSSNGTATAIVNSGQPPYVFTWSTGQTFTTNNASSTISNLPAGAYSVSVTDASGCLVESQVLVASACTGFDVGVSLTHVSCFGESNGSATATPLNGTAPYQINWGNGATGPSVSGLTAGAYHVTITDSKNCPLVRNFTITQPEALALVITATPVTSVNGFNGTAAATPSGGTPGYTYLWGNGATSSTQTGLTAGNYPVTVTDANGCTQTAVATVASFDCSDFQPNISWTNLTCFGSGNGSATATVSGGTNPIMYAWSNGGSGPSIGNLPAGNYTVSLSDDAGCAAQLTASVQQPPQLLANLSATAVSGAGVSDGTATANPMGGVPFTGGIYQYTWSNGSMTQTITGLSAGNYTVTVTDFNGCTVEGMIMVAGANCQLGISMSAQNASCPNTADGSASVTAVNNGTGPFTYAWSNGGTEASIAGLLPGNFTVTVSDINGCTANGWVPISGTDNIPPVLVLHPTYTINVGNGPYQLNPADLDNGSMDNCSMVNFQVSEQLFDCGDLGIKTVMVTGTDASGNASNQAVTLTITDLIPPVIQCPADISQTNCAPVSYAMPTALDQCGPTGIALAEGLTSGQVFPSGANNVVYEATDASGNQSVCSFTVTIDYQFFLENATVQNPECAGTPTGYIDLFIEGGLPPFQTLWSHGGGSSNLLAGTYSVTATDSNGCTFEEDFTLTDPPSIGIDLIGIVHAMGGAPTGSISVSVAGGTAPLEVRWFENGLYLPNFNPFAAPPGTYFLEVLDAQGCVASAGPYVVDNLNSIGENELERNLILFPNPSTGLVFWEIKTPFPSEMDIALLDVTGKEHFVKQITQMSGTGKLELGHLPAGVYWFKIIVGDEMALKKLVILGK